MTDDLFVYSSHLKVVLKRSSYTTASVVYIVVNMSNETLLDLKCKCLYFALFRLYFCILYVTQ